MRKQSGFLDNRILRAGCESWSRYLPALAACFAFLLLAGNLLAFGPVVRTYDLNGFLAPGELALLTLLAPLLFTRSANMVALFLVSYFFAKSLFSSSPASSRAAAIVLLICLAVIMTLGDRLPWFRLRKPTVFSEKLRSVLRLGISMISMLVVVGAMFKAPQFAKWMQTDLGWQMSPFVPLLGGALMLIAWLLITFNLTHHSLIAIIALPTTLAALYITGVTLQLIAIPFGAALALALIPQAYLGAHPRRY